jgi:Ser/Thr protein kinase RdoA (MazF antagonist)
MLPLRHLFDNRDLAQMLLANWDFDEDKMEYLDRYRISSNAVYPFSKQGSTCFLRFSPAEEKAPGSVRGELDFLFYLRSCGYPGAEVLLSREGQDIVEKDTPWGRFIAVAFRGVPGVRLDQLESSEAIIHGLGQSLGRLHRMSSRFATSGPLRQDWRQRLDWTKEVLTACGAPSLALEEHRILTDYFGGLPIDRKNYGLIHYDFELDNVFFDESTRIFTPIDFDDSVHHWFVMDLAQTLDSLEDEYPIEQHASNQRRFLSGYRSEWEVEESMLDRLPVFRRYAALFGYARVLRSIAEHWDHEPEWMMGLRQRLNLLCDARCAHFGEPTRCQE